MERNEGLVGILNSSLSGRRNSNNTSPSSSTSSLLWPFEAGLEPGVDFRHQNKSRIWCLKITDFVIAFTIFPTAVTISWRGIWQFLDVTLTTLPPGSNIDDYPHEKWNSIWTSLPICLVLSFFLSAFQFHCSAFLKKWHGNGGRWKDPILAIILKVTILISLILGVTCWRGFWDLWDLMLYKVNVMNNGQQRFQLAVIVFVLVNSFILVCWPLQVSRSLLSSPLQVSQDGGIEDIFESPTLFNKKPPTFSTHGYRNIDDSAWKWYFFDIFASTFLVQFLAVTCWWGIWTLEDKIIGPGTTSERLFIYLCVGYSCCFLAYSLQYTVTKDIPNLRQKFWSEVVVSVGVVGVVSVWKGIWDYSDVVLSSWIPIEDRSLNLAVQTMLAYLVLLLFNNTSLASNRGVVLDCPETVEARSQDLFVLDNLVVCCQNTQKQIPTLSYIIHDETSPLLQ